MTCAAREEEPVGACFVGAGRDGVQEGGVQLVDDDHQEEVDGVPPEEQDPPCAYGEESGACEPARAVVHVETDHAAAEPVELAFAEAETAAIAIVGAAG